MTSSSSRRGRPLGPPMLCKTIDVVPDDERYLASRKFDGWRARASCAEGKVTLTSREGHKLGSIPYVEAALEAVLAPGTVLDGELVDLARPRRLKRTGSILAAGKSHRPTPGDPPLTYAIFDVLFDGEEDLRNTPLHGRLDVLERLPARDGDRPRRSRHDQGPEAPLLMVVEHRPSSAQYAQELIDAGEEGVVIKHRDSLYRHGARNAGWWKYKPQQTVDAECTGIMPGEGSASSPGAVAFRLESGVEGSAGSGISAIEWLDMRDHPERYVGHVLELSHHGVERSGALRHPVYRGVRDPRDKASSSPRVRTPRRVPGASEAASAVANGPGRRRRNYQAMNDAKLLICIRQLRAGEGDAFERCVERGSGDPQGDLAAALDIANARGLSA